MTHTIDTKAIQELAATCPEARAYLEREFPEVFCTINYNGDYLIDDTEPDVLVKSNGLNANGSVNSKSLHFANKSIFEHTKNTHRKATTEEIQRFIPDYKPNTD